MLKFLRGTSKCDLGEIGAGRDGCCSIWNSSLGLGMLVALLLSGTPGWSQSFTQTDPTDIALYPMRNDFREVQDLSGIWNFKVDSLDQGEDRQWYQGLPDDGTLDVIAVPGSWNEQKQGLRDYMGTVWYEKRVFVPKNWANRPVYIRVGSATYMAKVWVNGRLVSTHEGGNIAFASELSEVLIPGEENLIAIRVENLLQPGRVPVGGERVTNTGGGILQGLPLANYDFFPYGGLQRAVLLYALPKHFIRDITVTTDIEDKTGIVRVDLEQSGGARSALVKIFNQGAEGKEAVAEMPVSFNDLADKNARVELRVPNVRSWSPDHPDLYTLEVSLLGKDALLDQYRLDFGVRTIRVAGDQLLLNGEPVYLRGFGKHEDFPVFGRGTALPVMIKDYDLMKWIGANSFRTSHYPYSEEYLDVADRQGILVIDETPSVGLFFDDSLVERRKQLCQQYIRELVARDKNRPSVIMWSLANEPIQAQDERRPGTYGVANQQSIRFFEDLFATVRALDTSRPSTMANMEKEPLEWLALGDVICINRYFGWYTDPGDLKTGTAQFAAELDFLHDQLHKPIIVTEFGADALPGTHALEPEMFSEEFQVAFLKDYLNAADARPFVAGMMVWAFADFKTSQGTTRTNGMNYKGVFTRDRKPKMAAHFLRRRWLQAAAREKAWRRKQHSGAVGSVQRMKGRF